MSSAPELSIQAAPTPNPSSRKYVLNRTLLDGAGFDFRSVGDAEASPLAAKLFAIAGVEGVFVGSSFVTVSVGLGEDPAILDAPVAEILKAHVASGDPAVDAEKLAEQRAAAEAAKQAGPMTTEDHIVRLLDTVIRPAVANDGGDIVFCGFEDGIVKLRLRGACHQCPSSLVTLKSGIENLLRRELPEVVGVEAVP